ncbi:MAG TPA: histidine kinase, partial [Chloroflexota bacterium]|nr:histidine kinase [Chloroflexota bacterium]
MSGPEVTSASHALGFSAGIILYGMLLVMVGQVRPRSVGPREPGGVAVAPVDRLLTGTAMAGVLWNAGALWIYSVRDFGLPAPAVLQVASFSALGFLPAFAVHAVARHEPGHRLGRGEWLLTAAGYALSITAAALQAWAAATGATVPSVAALRLLTAGFVVLVVPLAVLTRHQAGARRLLWVLALAVFAVTSLHLAEHHLHDRWFMELAGHHGSLLLAFAVLYQDYPFALADLFLKRALAIGGLLLIVFGDWAVLSPFIEGPSARPSGVPLLLGAWVATALAFPLVQRAASQLVDRLLLRALDYHDTVADLGQAVGRLDDEDQALDEACRRLQSALSALHVRSIRIPSDAGAATHGELASVDPRRLSGTVIIPTTEPPRYALEVSDLAGGRRLLSDEMSLLEHVGYVLGRRLDAIRLERERFARRLREEEISRREAEARLEALRAQINPHFLFNTLTTIGYLVQTSPAEAVRTLLRLTEVLRRVLRSDEHVA